MKIVDSLQLSLLVLFYLVFFGRTIMLHRQGVRVFVAGAGKSGARAVLEIVFFLGLPIWSCAIVSQALGVRFCMLPDAWMAPLFRNEYAAIVGTLTGYGGLCLFVYALVSFGRSWRIGIDKRNPDQLVTGGAFGISRNPVFLFLDLYFIGIFLAYPTPFFLACAVAVISGIHCQILEEEKFLSAHYGEAYQRYRRKVRRYM